MGASDKKSSNSFLVIQIGFMFVAILMGIPCEIASLKPGYSTIKTNYFVHFNAFSSCYSTLLLIRRRNPSYVELVFST